MPGLKYEKLHPAPVVGVDEAAVQLASKQSTNRGLPCPHQANKEDIVVLGMWHNQTR